MRLYVFDDHQLGASAADGGVVDITALVGEHVPPHDRMTTLIEGWTTLRGAVEEAANAAGASVDLASVTLLAPQPRPRVVVAAPVNYLRHQQEMGGEQGVYPGLVAHTIETYAGFVKASSSIVGPDAAIELPFEDRRVDHEGELAVVIGKTATGVHRADALDYVFGYVPLLDITLRGGEDRSYRKSFDTFTPIGPAIVTADEVPDPDALDLRLTVNGELRQAANTRDLIYGVARLIELYSGAMTLRPGDIIATGTPEGVGPLAPGDEVVLTVDRVGVLPMPVTRRQAPHPGDPALRTTAI
jgi:2-keto-4-pentenoate hydratase/2-oxohepta-3-ene-1,7-dioic acid hydratase in catechol pathway